MKVFRLTLLLIASAGLLHAVEPANGRQTRLRLPWETLQSLLGLDEKEVRLRGEEFEALLAQTGGEPVAHQTLAGGEVVLSREEFHHLISSLVPPPAGGAARGLLTKGNYDARFAGESVEVKATLHLEATQRRGKPITVEVLPGQLAFTSVLLDGAPAQTSLVNGRLAITVEKAGGHTLTAVYAVPAEAAERDQKLTIPLAPTPITTLRLELPEPNLDATVAGALRTEVQSQGGRTRVIAALPMSYQVEVAWNPMAPSAAKGAAQVYAETHHQLSIEDDALRVRTQMDLQILQNTLNRLTLDLPAGHSVLQVKAENMEEWREDAGRLEIQFRHAVKGHLPLEILTEEVLIGTRAVTNFTGVNLRGAVRERGTLGVDVKGSAEVAAQPKNLDRIDVTELPGQLVTRTTRQAFRFARPPFALALEIVRHEDVETVICAAQSAALTTLLLPDGRQVHQVTYMVKNTTKQFLEIGLPKGARLWNAFVQGEPVKPTDGGQGKLKVPLPRSLGQGDVLTAYPVELVYMEDRKPLGLFERRGFAFPTADVVVSRVQWFLYLPPELSYRYFGKSFQPILQPQMAFTASGGGQILEMEKAHAVGRVAAQMGLKKEVAATDGVESLEERDVPASAPQIAESRADYFVAGKVANDKDLAGVLPIRINVPLQGTRLEFAKTLPELGQPLELPLWSARQWILWVLAGILCLGLAGILAKNWWRISAAVSRRLQPFRSTRFRFASLGRPGVLVFAAAAFTVILAGRSLGLAVLGIFVFAGLLAWWMVSLVRGGRP